MATKRQNELINEKAELETRIYQCKHCDYGGKSRNELEDHGLEAHVQECDGLVAKFMELNSESLRLLEGVPVEDYIFMPEEITNLAIDWNIHLEICKILEEQKNKKRVIPAL